MKPPAAPLFLSRSHFLRAALVLICCLGAGRAFGNERAEIRAFALDFYKQYAQAQDPQQWIAKSSKVTPAFKTAYAAFLRKGPDHDPIVQGQDVPSSYEAGAVTIDGDRSTVMLLPQDEGFQTLKVHLVRQGDALLFNGVNGLKGAVKKPASAPAAEKAGTPLAECHKVQSQVGLLVRAAPNSKSRRIGSLQFGSKVKLAGEKIAGTDAVHAKVLPDVTADAPEGASWVQIKAPLEGYVLYTSDENPANNYLAPCDE